MATKHKVLRGVPGWPADVNGVWVRVGGVGAFPDKVTKGDRAAWLEVVATPKPPPPKPKPVATKPTKTTKRKTTKRKTTKRKTTKRSAVKQ